jgi:hypothetical protein
VPESLVVDQRPLLVAAVADLVLIDAEVLGNDQRTHIVQDVVPGKRAHVSTRAGAPEHLQLAEPRKPGSCSLDALEVKLVELFGGKDPMLVKIQTDELISFGDR